MERVRNAYIDNVELSKAKATYMEAVHFTPAFESVPVGESLGRVTREAIFARLSSPYYNAAAMDGIAVICNRTIGASEANPVILAQDEDFIYVNTGNPIQSPYDAVVMIEDVTEVEEGVKIIKAAHPWQHVRPIGEDIVAHEMILPSGHQIRGIDLGALLSGGIKTVEVYKELHVGILPTGSEIINSHEEIGVGKIIDSNSYMFEGLVREYGGIPRRYEPTEDDYEVLKSAILNGIRENDMMIVNAGSSAGSKDFTVHLIRELGEVIIHGIAVKPGKPTILGMIEGKPVIGIPGYPVSAYISFEHFVKPLVRKFGGLNVDSHDALMVQMAKRVVSSFKHQEKVRVTIGAIGDKYVAVPLSRGAGTTMSLVRADGIITIPQNSEGIEVGEMTEAQLLKPLSAIRETLVSVGSHDMVMDIIGDMMPLASSHVGSMGGIMALRRGECHIAPIHLLDEMTGEYNISYVKRFFTGKKMVLVKGVRRSQGFIVAKGNPKGINSFMDLAREDISYVNRQKGAGTRLLLDYHLKDEQIDPDTVTGYDRMMPTHMAVAVAVQSGTADTGLGIKSATKSLDLDFVEITFEDYDFLMDADTYESDRVQKLIQTLNSDAFRDKVAGIGGYETEQSGEVIRI